MFQFLILPKIELSHETAQRETRTGVRAIFKACRNDSLSIPHLWPISSHQDPQLLTMLFCDFVLCSLYPIKEFIHFIISFPFSWMLLFINKLAKISPLKFYVQLCQHHVDRLSLFCSTCPLVCWGLTEGHTHSRFIFPVHLSSPNADV